MKYKFTEEGLIVAEAETLQENAVLLSTQGALQLNVVKAPPHNLGETRKERKDKGQRHKQYKTRSDKGTHLPPKGRLKELKAKIDAIPRNSTGFISSADASASKRFVGYVWWRLGTKNIPYEVKEVPGGYEVAVH